MPARLWRACSLHSLAVRRMGGPLWCSLAYWQALTKGNFTSARAAGTSPPQPRPQGFALRARCAALAVRVCSGGASSARLRGKFLPRGYFEESFSPFTFMEKSGVYGSKTTLSRINRARLSSTQAGKFPPEPTRRQRRR